MKSPQVLELLKEDRWTLLEGETDSGPYVLRYRTPVLGPADTAGYDRLLTIVWPYANEETGALPGHEESEAMGQFEDRFCAAFEHDAHAILTAVLTFDGARQWVVYTGDIEECGRRLGAMPQEEEPYPIELSADTDPEWNYLRDEILQQAPPEA